LRASRPSFPQRRNIFSGIQDRFEQKKKELERLHVTNAPPSQQTGKLDIPGVKHIIAVSSAKGGVGKSTVSVNLALGLSKLGLKVGLFDGDIYGPSIPIMMNLRDLRVETEFNTTTNRETFIPLENYNIKCMSMGFLTSSDQAIVWRSPLAIRATLQMFDQVKWGDPDLDVLVVDFAPGTGDVQLTTVQRVQVSGAVVVTTPQPVALEDVQKGMDMFLKTKVPIYGIVENMAYHKCSKCNHHEYIFGKGGGNELAAKFGVDFLGEIPLNTRIRECGDEGKPIVIAEPNSPDAAIYLKIAQQIKDKLTAGGPEQPNFVIE